MALLLVGSPALAQDSGEGAGDMPPMGESATPVFTSAPIEFAPDGPSEATPDGLVTRDSGREILTSIDVAPPEGPHRTLLRVSVAPVPKDDVSVHDPWDRAGNVRLAVEGRPDIELVKFVTSYGGVTGHEVDVTHLSSLLRGRCEFRAFIDTWVSPAWRLSLSIVTVPAEEWQLREAGSGSVVADRVVPVLYEQSATAERLGADGLSTTVEVPEGTGRVVLYYLVSGHCTDGRGEDEFVSKDNVISVDGVVVERFRPWRDDCRSLRELNPYTRRWSDGWWSSDYSRSGWCPGDVVHPVRLDLSDHLTPGEHTLSFNIENVRPRDENDHYGYWRLSAFLAMWGAK